MKRDARRLLSDMTRGARAAAVSENPLDFIVEDHMRGREICAMIDKIASKVDVGQEDRGHVISFLKHQLPRHLADEEADLFPALLARCTPEDEIGQLIDRLNRDHGRARRDTPKIITHLSDQGAGQAGLSESVCHKMTAFAAQARRHLILENAVILPIARRRLTRKDLQIMKQHMLERRGMNRRP